MKNYQKAYAFHCKKLYYKSLISWAKYFHFHLKVKTLISYAIKAWSYNLKQKSFSNWKLLIHSNAIISQDSDVNNSTILPHLPNPTINESLDLSKFTTLANQIIENNDPNIRKKFIELTKKINASQQLSYT